MIDSFLTDFPDKLTCSQEVLDKHIFIYDDPVLKKGTFVNADESFHVHIQNERSGSYYFIQNDECIMLSVKGGQCDFVLFIKKLFIL